jgi:hypothetical protein
MNTLLLIVPTLIGAILVVTGNHLLSRRRDGSVKFRDSIIERLDGLYPLPVDWPEDIDATLRKLFPEMQIAVAEFRPYVWHWRRRAFDRAWYRFYCDSDTECEFENYSHYVSGPQARAKFKHNVQHLLSFA